MHAPSGRARIAYDITEARPGADVLLIHAGVTDRRSWRHVIERLRDRHRCLAFDQRGYGDTVYQAEDDWSSMSDALAVLDHAGVQRPVVVACSVGGRLAIDLALSDPERIAGLVLIGSAIRGAPAATAADDRAAELQARSEQAYEAGDLAEVGRCEARMWLDGPLATEGRVSGPARELFDQMLGQALRAPDPGPEADLPPAWPRLGEITVPVLLLVGRLDVQRIQDTNERAAALIPHAQLTWLEEVAHLPHLEADRTTLDAICEFVDAVAPQDRAK